MQRFRDFLKRKDIEISLRRYGIDALGAMAQGLFCSLLIGTILNTLGQQFHIGFLNAIIFTLGKGDAAVGYTIGGCASLMVGPAMAVAIGYALHAPAMVLFSLVPVGYATNAMGGAGGPLAVLVTAIIAAEFGKDWPPFCPKSRSDVRKSAAGLKELSHRFAQRMLIPVADTRIPATGHRIPQMAASCIPDLCVGSFLNTAQR